MNRINLPLIILLLINFVYNAEAQEEWTLQQCIDYALKNNIEIKQQSLNAEYNNKLLSQAKSNRLPGINANFSNSFNMGRSLTYENTYQNVNSSQIDGYLSADVTLWSGFTLGNKISKRKLDYQAALQELEQVKDNIILNIAGLYLEILFAEELTIITENQIDITLQQIDRTKKLLDAGSIALGDLLEIEAQLAREELKLVRDRNKVQIAYLNLYQLLELPEDERFIVSKPQLPEIKANETLAASNNVYNKALQIRPEIKAARLKVESAMRQMGIARGNQFPVLSFGINYYNLYNNKYTDIYGQPIGFTDQLGNNQRYALGLNLSIPLFNRFRVKNEISLASIEITDYKYQLQTVRNVLRKEIEQAYTNALAAMNSYIAGKKAVESTEEAFRYTREKFNVGIVNSIEFNQSKNYLAIARSELLQARYEYIFRAKILDFYNGVPIEL
jgi:outer membrane protein